MLHFAVEQAFDELLCAWRAHHDVTTNSCARLGERARVRQNLDRARNRMHELRIAVYPEADELESVVDRVWCEVLETVVHLRMADRDARWPGRFRCVCGQAVDIDWSALPADALSDRSG